MVRDENNFDDVRDAFDAGLETGLVELHSSVLKAVLRNMARGQDALGNSWEPIKASTLQSRKVRTSSTAPLVDTGDLRGDIASTSEVNTSELTAVIGTTKKYGKTHELGAPEAGIPRRPIFAPAAQLAEQKIPDTISEEIDVRLKGAEL
jgi:phage gpG-like protein